VKRMVTTLIGGTPLNGLLALAVMLALLVPGAAVPSAIAQSTGSASIVTHKSHYEPGTTVYYFGEGFQPGETVNLRAVADTNGTVVVSQTVAEATGQIDNSFKLPPIYEPNYVLTAMGAASGRTATTTFTDDLPSDTHLVVVSPSSPASVQSGSTANFKVEARGTFMDEICTGRPPNRTCVPDPKPNSLIGKTPTKWDPSSSGGTITEADGTALNAFNCFSTGNDGVAEVKYTAGSTTGSTFSLSARANDKTGQCNGSNLGAAISWSITITAATVVDTTPPDTNITAGLAEGSSTASTSASFEFTGTDNVPGTLTFECKLDAEPNFTACTSPQPYTGLTLGGHKFEVRAKDAANNVDASPATRNWTVTPPPDTTAPAKPTLDLDAASDSGSLNTDNVTNVTTPNFTGTAEAGSTVKVYQGGTTLLGSTTADATTGAWSLTLSTALAEGTYSITATATDAATNTSDPSDALSITIDTTAPALTVPADKTEEATSSAGAAVTFSATAIDAVDTTPTVTCTPTSGSTFALGTTTVKCTASDDAGNTSAEKTFTVKVQDTTPPALTVPNVDVTKEATSASGAAVTFAVSASDLVDQNPTVSCVKQGTTTAVASGDTFPLATTTVSCTAKDASNNTSTAQTFKVIVQDTTPPTLTVPSDITALATSASGKVVTFTATATDLVDSAPVVTCSPASGSTFPLGPTTVSCTAKDASNNTSAAKTFKVTITVEMKGFYQPTDMTTGERIYNAIKGGSTVPLKFEIFGDSNTELTATSIITQPLKAQKIDCGASTTLDEIELLATGGTSLRYDTSGGQFIYNWQTPNVAVGDCYQVTVSATDGKSSLSAYFKLK
jgi:hypothetical protein